MKILVESLLYQDNVDETIYKEFLSDINGEIDRLSDLITDLLLISKMDGDSMMINAEKIPLSDVVEKSVETLRPLAEKRGIEIRYRATDPMMIECDPLKLRQAINNLVDNAIKYTRSSGHVDATTRRNGQEAHVVIADDGVGMSEEHLAHIFERFYRVDKARSRGTGGTGLGLHIVRRIALMHGGRVEVTSREGSGSVFTLVLPVVQNKPEETDGA
jgi:signal transduction histidine kinase